MKCIKPTAVFPQKAKDNAQTALNQCGKRSYLFTSESVSEGHPDKPADRISDTILDHFLHKNPLAKVACETFAADSLVVIAGEFNTMSPGLFRTIMNEISGLVCRRLYMNESRCEPLSSFQSLSQIINVTILNMVQYLLIRRSNYAG